MPEGDALHRAARRLQVLVGQQLEVETPHPRAAVKGARAAARRPPARARRGDRQEPPAPLRGRARAAQPPAHEGTVARVAPRRADLRPALARAARRARASARCSTAPSSSSIRGIARRLGPDILAEPPDYDGDARSGCTRREPAAPGWRSAARPASRRGHRQPLEGGVALARARLAVEPAHRRLPSPTSARRSKRRIA